MLLRTLGCLELTDSSFSKPQPLLALCYLALEGKTSRAVLGELLWPGNDSTKRSKSLNTLLTDLKDLSLVEQEGTMLTATILTDAQQFLTACKHSDPSALTLYRGNFLPGLEHNKRLALSPTLNDWLEQKRTELHSRWLELRLQVASQGLKQAEAEEAARLTWLVYKDAKKCGEPQETLLKQTYALLLASGDKRKANQLRREAQRVYGIVWETGSILPNSTPPITGRDEELGFLKTLLLESKKQLVTLTGLGGVGKTALALTLAREIAYHFTKLGVVLLESVPPTAGPPILLAKIAKGLDLPLPHLSLEAVTREIADQSMLLVLDNAEQRSHLPPLLNSLLEVCPRLHCLVTSREALNFSYERRLTLQGLSIPPNETADFYAYGASRLFLETCQHHGTDVATQKREVLELCRLTEGLPLALHLAAPWANVLPLSDLIRSMRETMLVSHGAVDVPTRHQGLRATFDTSFGLLSESEQQAFTKLTVFTGKFGFTAVAALMELSVSQLRRFVELSLLRFSTEDGLYDLHPLVRHYALNKGENLAKIEETNVQEKHADHYLKQLGHLAGNQQAIKRETRQRLAKEVENVFLAWSYAVSRNDPRLYELSPALMTLCDHTARHHEGLALLEATLELGRPALWTGRIRACQAWLEHRLGNTAIFQRYLTQALDLLGDEDKRGQSLCYITSGIAHHDAGEFVKARAAFERDANLHPLHSGEYANALTNLALLHLQLGEYDVASRQLDEAQVHFETHGKVEKLLQVANVRGQLLLETGQPLRAQLCLLEALERLEKHPEFAYWSPLLQAHLARTYEQNGEVAKAKQAATVVSETSQDVWAVSAALTLLGDLETNPEQRQLYYLASLKKLKATRSVPAFLLLFLRLAEVSSDGDFATRLQGYCRNHKLQMSFADRARLQKFKRVYSDVADPWDDFEAYEIAGLVINHLSVTEKKQLDT
jgi:predicted ATPase/DNA-binding SARP family transcriptional activator